LIQDWIVTQIKEVKHKKIAQEILYWFRSTRSYIHS